MPRFYDLDSFDDNDRVTLSYVRKKLTTSTSTTITPSATYSFATSSSSSMPKAKGIFFDVLILITKVM